MSCCEIIKAAVSDLLLADFEGLEFNLSNDDFLKRIEDYELKQMVFLLIWLWR
jgi:hypothetical protein